MTGVDKVAGKLLVHVVINCAELLRIGDVLVYIVQVVQEAVECELEHSA